MTEDITPTYSADWHCIATDGWPTDATADYYLYDAADAGKPWDVMVCWFYSNDNGKGFCLSDGGIHGTHWALVPRPFTPKI